MTTWILNIGNSDIQLNDNTNWDNLLLNIYDQVYNCNFAPKKLENENLWTIPARVLGLVYGEELDTYFQDLSFPLLDAFTKTINQENIKINRIILLLSDQSNLFDEKQRYSQKSPYWKDTCTTQSIITKYLNKKFINVALESLILEPFANSKGLDSWDSTLDLVSNKLRQLSISERETIYVSHQAGTPALSSALQFITLSKFGDKVKFIVGSEADNQYCEIIDSSRYLRGLKVQQAKSLINHTPGGALKLLHNIADIEAEKIEQLQYFVDFFNLNRSSSEDEFSIESATQRIADVLDLIGIFLAQENYLSAITLLSSAQETFMKVAILKKTSVINISLDGKNKLGSEYLIWGNEGLHLINSLKSDIEKQNKILKQLNYPDKHKIEKKGDFSKINKNWVMLDWLKNLENTFYSWELLTWSCTYYRERENDLRNQLMHNLRGIEKEEVIKYLLADQNASGDDVSKIYNEQIKTPFFQALKTFNLEYTREKVTTQLKKLSLTFN